MRACTHLAVALAISASACGSDTNTPAGDIGASDTVGDTRSDATTPDTIAPDSAAPDVPRADTTPDAPDVGGECKRLLVTGAIAYDEGSTPDEGYVAFVLDSGDLGFGGELPDQLWIEFYETNDATIDDTGRFDLGSPGGNDNYATCSQCVSSYIDINDAAETYEGDLFQASGTLTVAAETPPSGGALTVTLADLVLVEVTIDPEDFTSTPLAGAPCYAIDGPVTLTTE